ncbi:hypothetical protein BDV38DRAFT_278977 [Aspergillus pseudotamarii]|uniref:ChrR-like cupin domain-containing protein n=1 Tax=Aspergillus pseudotamarii TaxID=132259 RepID=A0A5N6T5N0_ASPPS|nr:uncharacterized protein BDV38DRAFT_278977 [Aspergillus pseudotamarii]KAE8141623.1 hypothetical protein BDV38DRAFT_278977 [Aspergillus pseudotamarii]
MTTESSTPDHTLPSRPAPSKSAAVANNEESKLTALEKAELALADKYSSPDVYIDGERDTCWHPWLNNLELKPLRFESRTGTFVVVLRSLEDTWLGKHRHRGSVTAVTLKGEWNYKEYDWVAKPGDYVVENPGTIHTLHMSKGAEVVFTITGSLEYFHDDDTLKNTMDIFSYAHFDLVSFRHWRHPSRSEDGYLGLWEPGQTWVEVRIEALGVASYEFVDETETIAAEYEIISEEPVVLTPGTHSGIWNATNAVAYGCLPATDQASTALLPSSATHWNEARGDTIEHSTPAEAEQAYPQHDTSIVQSRTDSDGINDGASVQRMAISRSSNSTDDTGVTAIANKGAEALLSMRSHAFDPRLNYASSSISPPLSESSQRYWRQDSPIASVALPPTPDKLAPPAPLSSQEEAWLLRQFSTEVGTWMDLSDLSETFSKKVCRLAIQDPLLKAASIACAAKQQFLIGKLPNVMDIARRNYNTAISLLIDRLGNNDEPFVSYGFAATVICSCYEMLDAPASDWQRHLDGVFSFSKVRRVNGSSGGIQQAGFWSIARQEVVCSIIHRSKLRLDPDLWAIDLNHIGQEGSEDLVNNQILTILAKVVNFIACSDATSTSDALNEWYRLCDLLNHWNRSVKDRSFMDPVSVYKEDDKPFVTIWFARGVCASSWQMFHLAQILLLTSRPTQDGSWKITIPRKTNMWYSSKQPTRKLSCKFGSADLLCNNDEREAAIMLLEDIENDTGWAAKYRAWDLRSLCTDI